MKTCVMANWRLYMLLCASHGASQHTQPFQHTDPHEQLLSAQEPSLKLLDSLKPNPVQPRVHTDLR